MQRSLLALLFWACALWSDAHVFVFHRFGDDRHASTNTDLETLQLQFEYFKKQGYKVIPLSRLSDALHQGETIDPKWVVLTIDDSYRSFYTNALPIFKRYGYPFTLFVYIEATDKKYGDFMSWEQIKDASRYGEIGLHSFAHKHMVSLSSQEVAEDTKKAMQRFEAELGSKPRYYAYPYGEYSAETKERVTSFGFDLVLNQNSGAVAAQSDPYDLDRIALTGDVNLDPKLSLRTLNARWIAPIKYPDDGILKSIHAKISPSVSSAEYYVSGYGWERVAVINGDVNVTCNLPLKFSRNRIFIKNGSYQSSTIIVKE